MKRVIAVLLCVIIMIPMQGCVLSDISDAVGYRKRAINNTPLNQVGTTWCSENGKIQFVIVEEQDTVTDDGIPVKNGNQGVGTMEINGKVMDIVFTTNVGGWVFISDKNQETVFEEGIGDFEQQDQLTVTFSKKATYLEEGAVITFYRVDE